MEDNKIYDVYYQGRLWFTTDDKWDVRRELESLSVDDMNEYDVIIKEPPMDGFEDEETEYAGEDFMDKVLGFWC